MKLAHWIKNFLNEERMDSKTAFSVLGLEYGDYDGVDKAFKKMAMTHHPDRGGDAEMMKKVNQAKDALAGGTGSASKDKFDWEAVYKKHRMGNAELLKQFDEKMKPILGKSYEEYFEKVTGQKHHVAFTSKSNDNNAWFVVEYHSSDKNSYFTLDFSFSWKDSSGALAGPDMKEFDAHYSGYMFIGSKKFKLSNRSWKFIKFDAKDFENPAKIFPEAKIKKAMSTNAEKPLKRADVEEFMKVKFGARTSLDTQKNTIAYIPLNGKWGEADFALVMVRGVMMKKGIWSIHGLAQKTEAFTIGDKEFPVKYVMGKNSIKALGYTSLYEGRKLLEVMPEIVKVAEKCAKAGNANELVAYAKEIAPSLYEE